MRLARLLTRRCSPALATRRPPCACAAPPQPLLCPQARQPPHRRPLLAAAAAAAAAAAWAAPARCAESLYSVLGVEKTASEDEIKRAYKKAALKHHPDKGGDAEAFKRIAKAYEVLSDPEKKQAYDTYGEAGLGGGPGGGPGGAGGSGFHGTDPFDLFRQMFGGGGGGGGGWGGAQSALYKMEVSLEEVDKGVAKTFSYPRTTVCRACSGRGAKNVRRCPGCDGRGVAITERRMGNSVFRMQSACSQCGGTGQYADPEDICEECKGEGQQTKSQSLTVEVPAGCADGRQFVFHGKADEVPGAPSTHRQFGAGDVIVVVQSAKHPRFVRAGEHLLLEKRLPLIDALAGAAPTVRLLDGTEITAVGKAGEVVAPGDVWVLSGKGLPRGSGYGNSRGDLFIRFSVDFPRKLGAPLGGEGEEEAAALKQLETVLGQKKGAGAGGGGGVFSGWWNRGKSEGGASGGKGGGGSVTAHRASSAELSALRRAEARQASERERMDGF